MPDVVSNLLSACGIYPYMLRSIGEVEEACSEFSAVSPALRTMLPKMVRICTEEICKALIPLEIESLMKETF